MIPPSTYFLIFTTWVTKIDSVSSNKNRYGLLLIIEMKNQTLIGRLLIKIPSYSFSKTESPTKLRESTRVIICKKLINQTISFFRIM